MYGKIFIVIGTTLLIIAFIFGNRLKKMNESSSDKEMDKKSKTTIEEKHESILKSKGKIYDSLSLMSGLIISLGLILESLTFVHTTNKNDGCLMFLIIICAIVSSFLSFINDIHLYNYKKGLDFSKNKKSIYKVLEKEKKECDEIESGIICTIFVIGCIIFLFNHSINFY